MDSQKVKAANITKRNIALISYGDCEYDGRLRSFVEVLKHCGSLYCFTRGNIAVNDESKTFAGKKYCVFIWDSIKYIDGILKKKPIHVIFLDNRRSTIPGLILKRMYPNIKFVIDCRELYLRKEVKHFCEKIGCIFEKKMIKKAQGVICANQERAEIMQKEYGLSKAPIVFENLRCLKYDSEEALDRARVKLEKYIINGEIRIISTSGCNIKRTNDILIRNMNKVEKKCRLFLVGNSTSEEQKRIENIIQEQDLDNVEILGQLNQAELKYLISQCNIGIVNYGKYDTNNLFCASGKLYEFLYEGIPVVTTTNPPLKRICDTHGIGIADDYYAEGINNIIRKYEYYKKM